ncbi:uncharacterized protein ARB_00176 [Trichophyton benhamiae CBS 112371]|uniref:Uncharacterized protein n=1 Tax=Arthroderma benhamiae (strain ATCC MYA-4681 / CBS 112371) TaxID=663331 RepID=D4AVG3_ARTBC|nr:uncharacterized protein ARB_00176 [Trichophyton benhamiae CBS 112371]EFE33085.1 hypothetical protein ARB_00176 [Trichophyton benhamiae CBS 112371]
MQSCLLITSGDRQAPPASRSARDEAAPRPPASFCSASQPVIPSVNPPFRLFDPSGFRRSVIGAESSASGHAEKKNKKSQRRPGEDKKKKKTRSREQEKPGWLRSSDWTLDGPDWRPYSSD